MRNLLLALAVSSSLAAQTPQSKTPAAAAPCDTSSVLLKAPPIKGVGVKTLAASCPAFAIAVQTWYAANATTVATWTPAQIIAAIATGAKPSTPPVVPPPPPVVPPAVLPPVVPLQPGFQKPNILNATFASGWDGFTDWTGGNAPQGVTREQLTDGTWSVKRAWTASASEGGSQMLFKIAATDHVWVRFYFRLTAPITSIMKFARFYDPNFNTALGGIFLEDVFIWGTDQENSAISTDIGLPKLADGAWHSFEMEYWRNGDPSGFPSAAFWLDGASVSPPSGTKTKYQCPGPGTCSNMYWSGGRLYSGERKNSLKIGYMEWLATLNAGNTSNGQVNVNRIAISTVGRIGP